MAVKYTLLLENDCSIRVYQSFAAIFQKYFWYYICLMFSVTYYDQNYAGIIGWSLIAICEIIPLKNIQ